MIIICAPSFSLPAFFCFCEMSPSRVPQATMKHGQRAPHANIRFQMRTPQQAVTDVHAVCNVASLRR